MRWDEGPGRRGFTDPLAVQFIRHCDPDPDEPWDSEMPLLRAQDEMPGTDTFIRRNAVR